MQQQRVWQSDIAQDRLNLLHKQAGFAYDDPESVANYANAGRSAALHQASLSSFDPDSEEADARASDAASGIWRSAIQTALYGLHTAPAIALWQKADAALSPQDSAALAPQIEAAKEHQTGQDYLATLRVPDTRDLNAIGEAHQAAMAQNETDWPHNDRQRATNQHFIDIAFNRKKRDAVKAKADLDQQLSDLVYRPGATGPIPLHLLVQLDDDTRRHVYRQLAQNAFDPLENVKDSYAKRSGASPGVEPQPESFEDGPTTDQVQRPQVVDRDAGQAEKDRAITGEIVRRAAVDAQNGTVKDSVTDPKLRDEIARGLMSEDPQERLRKSQSGPGMGLLFAWTYCHEIEKLERSDASSARRRKRRHSRPTKKLAMQKSKKMAELL